MSELTKDEYERLGLQDALEYEIVTTYECRTYQCEGLEQEIIVDTRDGSTTFIYANQVMPDGKEVLRYVPANSVCTKCMTVMVETDTKYFKKEDEPKYRVYAKKAKGDRSKHYFRDFSATKSVTTAEPGVGQDATTLSKKDIANFEKNMKGKI